MGAILPSPGILLYLFLTEGTIEHFGGTATPTALFWCSNVAAVAAQYCPIWSIPILFVGERLGDASSPLRRLVRPVDGVAARLLSGLRSNNSTRRQQQQ